MHGFLSIPFHLHDGGIFCHDARRGIENEELCLEEHERYNEKEEPANKRVKDAANNLAFGNNEVDALNIAVHAECCYEREEGKERDGYCTNEPEDDSVFNGNASPPHGEVFLCCGVHGELLAVELDILLYTVRLKEPGNFLGKLSHAIAFFSHVNGLREV